MQVAVLIVREKGFAATSVDDLCKAAGVTKGAFFHHFESKEALGVELARYWAQTTGEMFCTAPYHQPEDPLERVLAYVDFRRDILTGEIADFTCVAGTMTQEVYNSFTAIRDACGEAIFGHAETLEADFNAAIDQYGVTDTTGKSLARHTQAVLQGAFILAKAGGGQAIVRESLAHLRRYLELLFGQGPSDGNNHSIAKGKDNVEHKA